MPDNDHPYSRLSREELRSAESTARQFLEDNCQQIAETLRAKTRFIETLIERVARKKTSFEDRLEYLARISEIAQLIEDDADGFFSLASQPVVAGILSGVPRR